MALLTSSFPEVQRNPPAEARAPIKLAIVQSLFHPEQKPLFDRIRRHTEIALRLFTLKQSDTDRSIWQPGADNVRFGNARHSSCGQLYDGELKNTYRESRNFIFAPSLSIRLAMWSPDVVVCEGFNELMNVLPSEFLSCLRIVTGVSPSSEAASNSPAWKQYLTGFMYRTADAYIAVGNTSAMYLRNIGVETSQIFSTISTRMDASSSYKKKRAYLYTPDRVCSWLSVGEFGSNSGYTNLIRAWAAQTEDFKRRNTLLIIGEGTEETALRRLIESQNLDGNIRLSRFPTSEELNTLYAQSDVFVCPGQEPHWSSWIGEATAVGLPILCSHYPDHLGGLAHKLGHSAFDPRNADAFNRAISSFWHRRDQWHAMGSLSINWLSDNKEQIAADTLIKAALHAVGRVARAN